MTNHTTEPATDPAEPVTDRVDGVDCGCVTGPENCPDGWAGWVRVLVAALYRQGRSVREVSIRVGMPVHEVTAIVRAAGVIRGSRAATSVSNQRVRARATITRLDLAGLADRWLGGCEVEDLAAEAAVPADLLWDVLADRLSTMNSDMATGTDRGRGSGTDSDVDTDADAVDAAGGVGREGCAGVCRFGCAQRCALTTGSDSARPPGTPAGPRQPHRHEGIRYVRTGLALPASGVRDRWGP
jgi:hypothetical protein